jgi:serine-type D-Ala-D-Ala carboxypeptidase
MHKKISEFLQSGIDAGDFPSAVYLVAERGEIVFQDALGHAVVEPERIQARLDTIYDVASLTKPLVTGLLAAQQVEDGELEIEARISDYLPEFNAEAVRAITVRDVITHASGLPAWRPLYILASSANEVASVIAAEVPRAEKRVEYSDLNFITLGLLLRSLRPDSTFDLDVAAGLGLTRTTFNPLSYGFGRREIAASESGNQYERQMCVELGYFPDAESPLADGVHNPRSAIRDQTIWGEVHDGNAYFMDGVAGHAGLFSTAEEVFKIALQFLPNYTRLLKPETCDLFRTNFTKGMNEDRSFAFQVASTEGSTAGTRMSPESFGHNGFTGTSLWIDPVRDRVYVLLTNRTHNHPLPFVNINSVRREFHDTAVDLLDRG